MDYKDYLQGMVIPLGVMAQFIRGNGVSLKWVSTIMFIACVGLVWLARGPAEPIPQTVFEGIVWISGAFGAMFGTAAGAYAYAAGGKNPEERAERAASPVIPVTDPDKTITVKP